MSRPPDAVVAATVGAAVALCVVVATWRTSGLGDDEREWVAPAAVMTGAAFGAALGPGRRAVRMPGALPFATLCSAVAVYGCVPETGQMVAVGSAVAIVVGAEVIRWKPLPIVWHAAAGALVLWSGLFGATGRPSALIGALFALVPIPLLGLWLWLSPRVPRRPVSTVTAIAVLATGSVAAVAMARTGGIEPFDAFGTASAWRWLLVWSVVALLGSALVVAAGRVSAARSDQRRRSP